MSNASIPTCPRCGVPVSAAVSDQLCPACLMSAALKAPSHQTATVTVRPEASSPQFSKFPCQFGGYRLLGLLGSGGMGTVYDAEQLATGRRVALKMLGQQFDSPDARQRFLREGRLAASVNHPNCLYIFGSEEIEGAPVITMEIAGRGTLKDRLKRHGPLAVTDAVDSILEVIVGLEAAYDHGVLHRDIKPSNCFVSPDGSVKVGDFGLSVSTLAKDDSYLTATGLIMGTPAYASPEQLRGDELDIRADIYSIGATLFTLLTGRAPFEGDNAVQVVANAVNQTAPALSEARAEMPAGLDDVVACCLEKRPEARYSDYAALRKALLPFSSKEPEPASMRVRLPAGWIDYLTAFFIPFLILVLIVGSQEFHLRPLVDRSIYSARYYFAFLGFGLFYFSVIEGVWGAGLGKRLKGLRVVRTDGGRPGIGRALIRILIPILSIELVRVPVLLVTIAANDIQDVTNSQVYLYIIVCNICPWIPILLTLGARRENGFATIWDLATGTRVVVDPTGSERPKLAASVPSEFAAQDAQALGPYLRVKELVPGRWILATDPVLRRQVWLLRRDTLELSPARRQVARSGRLRWLQTVTVADGTWEAFEAPQGSPFTSLVAGGQRIPWSTLRHWIHDLATELWAATGDQTLPSRLDLRQVWITAPGRAVLLDLPWYDVETEHESFAAAELPEQQRFLSRFAGHVDPMRLPLHARPVLQNLEQAKFTRLSFLTGVLRGLLNKPADVSRGIRAGSIFMLPLYIWATVALGSYAAGNYEGWDVILGWFVAISLLVLVARAVVQLLEMPTRTTCSHSIFGLAVVSSGGDRPSYSRLFVRWAIVWAPLLLPLLCLLPMVKSAGTAITIFAVVWMFLWIGLAVYAVVHPQRGWHDQLAGTWLVRR